MFLSKVIIVGLLLVLQIGIIVYGMISLGKYFAYVQALCTILSLVVVIYIINKPDNPAYKLAWVVPILLFPIFGGVFYVAIAGNHASKHFVRKIEKSITDACRFLKQDEEVAEHLDSVSEIAGMQSKYIRDWGKYPVFQNTEVTYYPFGEDNFEPLLEELKKAKRYIFMEYFIIREGLFWNSVLEILEQKVKEGVDVRVMFDDMGCVATIPSGYENRLREKGIRCYSFNRFIPILTLRLNNRDHRKITVIDGHTGFTGGINLADEYINATHPFGHWKDTAIRLEGDAARTFTLLFLQMWQMDRRDFSFGPWLEMPAALPEGDGGYVIPYGDHPLDGEPVGEWVYTHILNQARDYVHIMTPYLILDSELEAALRFAARRGVEVTLILPHIPDKKIPFALAKTHFLPLMEAGVRIYEYTPGFLHAKVFVSDGLRGTVGTVNLDYRSLYHHFECGAYLCGGPCAARLEKDFQETLAQSQLVTRQEAAHPGPLWRLLGMLAKVLAPLM